jgi:predicted transcriptional regulator
MDPEPELQRDILVSIRPVFATKILEGQKSVELRRRFPIQAGAGCRLLIYSSRPVSAVVGFARIKTVLKLPVARIGEIMRLPPAYREKNLMPTSLVCNSDL